MPFDEFYQFMQKDRVWNSCERELEHAGSDVEKISLSPLGRLMEDLMFSSKSLKDCLKSFGNNSTASDGMLTFIVLQIPLVGGTFYTVMEFYGLGNTILT
jgi:hypothetical protein